VIDAQVVVLAKTPAPGRVKTRLCPPYTPEQAARLAAAALLDTLSAVAAVAVAARVLALDGAPAPPAPGFTVLPQRGAGLAERIAAALDDAYAATPYPLLLIGMDTPQLTPGLLAEALRLLLRPGTDAVLGPAADGGWWGLGLRRPNPRLLDGVPMSTTDTCRAQRTRLQDAGLRVAELPRLTDVDTATTAREVAAAGPSTRFAAAMAAEHLA
jgi:uncharacterized protein